MNWQKFFDGMKNGALMMLPISAACATAGIVVGVIGQTGLGLQFTEFVLSLSGGNLVLALGLVAMAALVLGMGLPVTAAYIILAVMAAPAMENLGVYLIVGHMAIFWLSQTSNVTPPVALAAFAAAGVANARPQRSAVESLKLANGFFVLPVLMVFTDILFVEGVTWQGFAFSLAVSTALVFALACAIEAYAFNRTTAVQRMLFFLAIPALLVYDTTLSTLGIGLMLVAGYLNYRTHRAA